MSYFDRVKEFLTTLEMDFSISNEHDQVLIVNDERRGIQNLVLDCEDSLLILEQFICELSDSSNAEHLLALLKMNRHLIHGAFVIDDKGEKVLFRDTLQLAHLDLNELDASITSLGLGLAENAKALISMAKRS